MKNICVNTLFIFLVTVYFSCTATVPEKSINQIVFQKVIDINLSKDDLYKFIKNLCINRSKDKERIHKIKLLTFPKVLSFGFNPLSVYFCYDKKGLLMHSIFEVRNTFGDMHHYVLRNINLKNISQKTSKKLFVSPFYPKKGNYKKFDMISLVNLFFSSYENIYK